MKIAVIGGSGNVGSRLAHRLCLAGHDIVLASRDPNDEKAKRAVAAVHEGASGSVTAAAFQEASVAAEAIIIATPGQSSPEAWQKIVEPFAAYAGVVLDASNPLTAWPALEISVDQNQTSATEDLQKVLPQAKVFKAFNTLGAELMSNPTVGGKQLAMMFAGPDDAAAKETAIKVISDVGYRPEYVGPARYARNLESIAELWIHLAIKYGWKRDGFAFDILKE